jgi:hypothetical protein
LVGAQVVERDRYERQDACRSKQRGLLRLMLKLPLLRGQLQILAGRSMPLGELCQAYGEASAMLERVENGRLSSEEGLVVEYRFLCADIEAEVIQYCLERD